VKWTQRGPSALFIVMPSRQLMNAQHWRERASNMRAAADGSDDIEAARTMYQLAKDYDNLAAPAEQRNGGSPRLLPSAMPKEREP
jgi:hypothetical protein